MRHRIETQVHTRPAPGEQVRTLAGKGVAELNPRQLRLAAHQVHTRLGENSRFMHQPSINKVFDGMEQGDFVLSVVDSGVVVATSHLRPAKSGDGRRELGGVWAMKGQGKKVVEEGVRLALEEQGATGVELLVAEQNEPAQRFFRRIPGIVEIGWRPSDYVKDVNGRPLEMTIFDATSVGRSN